MGLKGLMCDLGVEQQGEIGCLSLQGCKGLKHTL